MLYVVPIRPAGAKYCQKELYTIHGKVYQAKNVTYNNQIVHDCETLYEQEGMCSWWAQEAISLYQQLPKMEVKYLEELHGGEHESTGWKNSEKNKWE